METLDLKIGYAGMSHLGINSSVAAAEKVSSVIAFDNDKVIIDQLSAGNTNIDEPNLNEKINELKEKIKYTSSITDLFDCDIVYISQDVPTNDNGESNFNLINKLIKHVNSSIKKEANLIILCQVPPGFTRKINRKNSKLYYQVETLIFGRAIERATLPERIILGCFDNGHLIDPKLIEFLNMFKCPIIPMIYESAELAKTAINIVLAAQVSVANSLAEICEKSKGDWNEIIPALKLDKRIGNFAYLSPGLGISGGNIERDLKTLSKISKKNKGNNIFLDSIIKLSKYRKKWPNEVFKKENINNEIKNVCVLGLSYKLDTNSIKNSPSIDLIKSFQKMNIKVYDPLIKKINNLDEVQFCSSAYEAINGSDALFIMLPYNEFKNLNWDKVFGLMKRHVLIDPFRVMNEKIINIQMSHHVLGKNEKL